MIDSREKFRCILYAIFMALLAAEWQCRLVAIVKVTIVPFLCLYFLRLR